MIRLPNPVEKRKAESTISLINVVFLMLIFFLIAGQLSPPVDPEVELVRTEQAPPLPPPDALFVDAEGELRYRGKPISAEAFMVQRRQDVAREAAGGSAITGEAGGSASAPVAATEETGAASAPASGAVSRDGPPVMLAADRALAADRLLEVVDGLYRLGASKVSLVTTGQDQETGQGTDASASEVSATDGGGADPRAIERPSEAGAGQ